jgi:hypothetical protein
MKKAHCVIDCLPLVGVKWLCRNNRTRVHDTTPEQRLAFVRVVTIVQEHLIHD